MISIASAHEHVIILHGLCRSPRSMSPVETVLKQHGYIVHNIAYPSRQKKIQQLSEETIPPAVAKCLSQKATRIHFVTHSMGGILVRDYLSRHDHPRLGKTVMLAPPNGGSEIVDKLGHWQLFDWINGPAGQELSTSPHSTVRKIPQSRHSIGVIAGSLSLNWINSCLIPGADDGKVSVENTKLAGAHHITIRTTHPTIMYNSRVHAHILHFLRNSKFSHENPQVPDFPFPKRDSCSLFLSNETNHRIRRSRPYGRKHGPLLKG